MAGPDGDRVTIGRRRLLLDKVEQQCKSTIIKEAVYRTIGENKRLVAAHEHVPNEICDAAFRRNLLEKRVQKLFRSK